MGNKKKEVKDYLLLNILLMGYSFSGICSKLASNEIVFSWRWSIFYGISVIILFGYAIIWQNILKRLPLVNAYANKAITIIWGIIWGKIFFHEPVTIKKIIGSVILGIGIYYVISEERV